MVVVQYPVVQDSGQIMLTFPPPEKLDIVFCKKVQAKRTKNATYAVYMEY